MQLFRLGSVLSLIAMGALAPTAYATLDCEFAVEDRISNLWQTEARVALDKVIDDFFTANWNHIEDRPKSVEFLKSVLFDKNFLEDPSGFYKRWVRPDEMIPRPTHNLTSPAQAFLKKYVGSDLLALLKECRMPTTVSSISVEWRDEARQELHTIIESYYDKNWSHIGEHRQASIRFLMAQLTDPVFLSNPKGFYARWMDPTEMKPRMTSFKTSPAEGFLTEAKSEDRLHKLVALIKEADLPEPLKDTVQ